jgi:hypothetical protein
MENATAWVTFGIYFSISSVANRVGQSGSFCEIFFAAGPL